MENNLSKLSADEKEKIISSTLRRINASYKYYLNDYDNAEKCYKIYHRISDGVVSEDEPNIFLPTAYGIVEDAVARLAIPLLQKLSINVKPKKIDDSEKAKKYWNICRDFYSKSSFRQKFIKSKREEIICGWAWEIYEWKNDWSDGMIWKNVPRQEEAEYSVPLLERFKKSIKTIVGYNSTEEVPHKFAEAIGPDVRFPSLFNMFPAPGFTEFSQLPWVIEVDPMVSVESLKKAKYFDRETQTEIPMYDLTEVIAAFGEENKIRPISLQLNHEKNIAEILHEHNEETGDDPALHLMRVYGRDNTLKVIANGKYVILSLKNCWHRPGLPMQLRTYTQTLNSLYGEGIIQPIADCIFELNEIHNLSYSNWVRIINKMVVYDESVIKYVDDFKPRAGGKIRADLKGSGRVSDAFAAIDQPDVVSSMLSMESNTKGMIERTVSISDLSPGVEGTRQYHKTATGLMEIQNNLAKRFTIMLNNSLSYIQNHMEIMYWQFEQFMFTPMDYGVTNEQGIFKAEQYTREDIITDRGFIFLQSDDPSFGDDTVQRNQLMVLLEKAMSYESMRLQMNKKEWSEAKVDKFFKLVLESFGQTDTSQLLSISSGVKNPEEEYAMILQGIMPQVNPREDLMSHAIAHINQRRNPEFLNAVAQGKIPAQVVVMLQQHIDATLKMIDIMLKNIDQVSEVKQGVDKLQEPNAIPMAAVNNEIPQEGA